MINKNIIFAEEDIIAHGCNCQGKMGSGVAKAIRARFPSAYTQYVDLCSSKKPKELLGIAQIILADSVNKKFVANCFTQEYYGYDLKRYASQEAIEKSLTEVAEFANKYNYSVALPPIGCGLGGLSWDTIGPIVEKIFTSKRVKFTVYDYKTENWRTESL